MLNEKIYGFKHSKHREAILDVLSKSDNPLTAQELHEKIGVSIPTVYRILEQLCEKGIVAKRAILDSKTSSYEISGHRHYAVCLGCKKIKPLSVCPFEHIDDEVDSDGFEVTGHKIEVYGYCRECRKNRGEV